MIEHAVVGILLVAWACCWAYVAYREGQESILGEYDEMGCQSYYLGTGGKAK